MPQKLTCFVPRIKNVFSLSVTHLTSRKECVQVDFKDEEISYEELCGLFFKSHECSMGSSKRQYMSAIFAHTDEQFETASRVLHAVKQNKSPAEKARVSTQVEMATDFYEGEFYHQKWLLQRKADWF